MSIPQEVRTVPPRPPSAPRTALRLLASYAAIAVLMLGLGLLVTGPLASHWPLTAEDGLVAQLAGDRTPGWNRITDDVDDLANTTTVIATGLAVVVLLRVALRRWLEALTVAITVTGQSAVFLLTTLVIDRARPTVPHLDAAPPTSSFPSGHTGAATALYVSVALVLARRTRSGWRRLLVLVPGVLVPLAVGFARVYRGMHHPSDVAAGLLNGTLCILAGATAFSGAGAGPVSRFPLAAGRAMRMRR